MSGQARVGRYPALGLNDLVDRIVFPPTQLRMIIPLLHVIARRALQDDILRYRFGRC
jgi:hypothetical protein